MSVKKKRSTFVAVLAGLSTAVAIAVAGPALGASAHPMAELSGTHYIDNGASSHCSDSGTGRTPSRPWCDFTNLNGQTLAAGTHILLKSGDTFTGELGKLYGIGTAQRQIVLGSYGTGARPLIQRTGAATDRAVWIQDASYWTVENLQVSNAGAGLVFWYSSNGHRGLTIKNVYTFNIQGVFAGVPAQADLPGMYHSAGILITGSVPVTTNQTALTGLDVSDVEGYNDNDDFDISGFNAVSGGQQGFLSTALTDHSVSGVTLTNAYFHHSLSGENFDNLNDMTITAMRLQDTGLGRNATSGTTALFFWSSSSVTVADSILTGEANTGSPDQTETDLEAFNRNIHFVGNYYGQSAGGGIEILEINGYADNHQDGHLIADSAFESTGGSAFFDVTPATPASFSGTASANLYGPNGSVALSVIGNPGSAGNLPGWTYKDNKAATSGVIYNAGKDFGPNQGSNGWSQQYLGSGNAHVGGCAAGAPGAGQWKNLGLFDTATNTWTQQGTVSATTLQPANGIRCAVARAWTAPASGTISLRGRVVAEGESNSETARITVNGRQVWPAQAGALSISAKATDGYASDANLFVHSGDVVRFELANAGVASSPVAWMPSIAYTDPAPVTINDDDAAVGYSAGWTDQGGLAGYLNSDAHYSNTAGTVATVTFTGTGISWFGKKAPDHGRADVAVCDATGSNCGPVTTVDTFASTPATEQSLFTAAGLPYGTHTLTITIDSGTSGSASYVDIDSFTLTGTNLNDADPGVTYSSGWTYQQNQGGSYDSDLHSSDHVGATAQVAFTGSGITWIGSTADRGRAQVVVCETAGTNCGAPQLVTPFDPLSDTQQPLYSVDGLNFGPHVLTITVLPGSAPHAAVDIDAFAIDTSPKVDDADAAVSYSAGWASTPKAGYYDGDAHYSGTTGSTATVTFTGTGITWIGGRANDHGRADVSTCNASGAACGPTTLVDTYATAAQAQQELYSVSGLAYGTHTLKITLRSDSSGAGTYTDVDAFTVAG